jgi:membrane fusion protein (multidrug efflux system)
MKRHLPFAASALAATLASIVLVGCGGPPGGPPPAAGGTPQVSVLTLQPQRVALTTELPGRVASTVSAEVRPQVSGIVQKRLFAEGSTVHAGQLLYQIDPAGYRAAVDNAAATLAKAQASLEAAKLKAARNHELVAIQAVSRQDADDADSALKQAEADVASAKAALETQRINLAYTRVTAPVAGRIGRSSVTPGALVTANQASALATVQQLDPVYVDVTQPSAALLVLKRSLADGTLKNAAAKVKLVLEDGSTYAEPGVLKFSEVNVDPNTGSVTLRVQVPNPRGELLPGMYVRAVVEQGVLENALLVPQQALARDAAGQASVAVVGADGKLQRRSVTATRPIGDQWLVSSGLAAGDRVAVEGQQKVTPGTAVQAMPLDAGKAPSKIAQR